MYKFPRVNGSPAVRLRRVQIGLPCAKRYSWRRDKRNRLSRKKEKLLSRIHGGPRFDRSLLLTNRNSVGVTVSRGQIAVFVSYDWRVDEARHNCTSVVRSVAKGYGSIL